MKNMKNLFKGFVLTMIVFVAFGFELAAQDYKPATESNTIIQTEQAAVLQQLNSVDPNSSAYAELKQKVVAYNAMTEVLGHEDVTDELVEEAIITGIIAGAENRVTADEYFSDDITDQVGVTLKDHLEALLAN